MFKPDWLYTPTDEALRQIAATQTLARWRHEGKGPKYVKLGGRVRYRGADIVDWVNAQTVETVI